MALAIDSTDGQGLNNIAHREFLSKKQGNAVFTIHFTVKCVLISCTLLTRWSASVLKVECAMQIAKLIKEDWPIVTVKILA